MSVLMIAVTACTNDEADREHCGGMGASCPTTTLGSTTTLTSGAQDAPSPDLVLQRPEIAPILNRYWRVVAYGTPGGEKPASPDYTSTLSFVLDTNGNAKVTTYGCLGETFPITFNTDNTFVVGARTGDIAVCANPNDEDHVADALTESATVQWSIGTDGRLTLTSTGVTPSAVVYD